jgi:hypothetical protein
MSMLLRVLFLNVTVFNSGSFSSSPVHLSDSALLAGSLRPTNGMATYNREIEEEMMQFCRLLLAEHLPMKKIFHCIPWG